MLHPKIIATVDGSPISGNALNRLVSLTISDREGIRSDELSLTFDDSAPHFEAPRRGAIVSVSISGNLIGAYVITQVEFEVLPHKIMVKGHSADLRSNMKTNKVKHWDNVSVRDIVKEKAGNYGLKASISEAVSGHVYDWIGQQDESDLSFLERLARRHGALFTIKNGVLLWLERGRGETAGGTSLPVAVVPAPSIVRHTCKFTESDVDSFATVKAYWQDHKGARRQDVVVKADPKAEGERVLPAAFSSRSEAEKAASAAAQEIIRGQVQVSCTIEGRPDIMAGQPLQFFGVRPDFDGRVFILEQVTHTFTKGAGLRTAFSGKLRSE